MANQKQYEVQYEAEHSGDYKDRGRLEIPVLIGGVICFLLYVGAQLIK